MSKRFGGLQGRYWRHTFLRRFCEQIRSIAGPNAGRWSKEARRQAEDIYELRTTTNLDRKGHMIQMMCSHILGAYRVVREQTGDATVAFGVVKEAMEQTLRRPMNLMVRAFLKLYRDPVGKLSRMNFITLGRRNYGDTMVFDQEQGERHVDMLVRRCAVSSVFRGSRRAGPDVDAVQLGPQLDAVARRFESSGASRAAFDHFDRRRLLPISVCAGG